MTTLSTGYSDRYKQEYSMLNRKDIIREYHKAVRELGINPADMLVGAGGACVLYGVREQTQDIDADVPDALFDKLLKTNKYKLSYFQMGSVSVEVLEYNEVIDLHRRSAYTQSSVVEGVHCYSVQQVLQQKLRLNRPKDQEDIVKLSMMDSSHFWKEGA